MIANNELLSRYAGTRDLRDQIREARDGCLCERHEGVDENMEPRSGEPCWKSARQWDHEVAWDGEPTGRTRFRFDPPIDAWCYSCRQRQAFTERLRAAVKDHAAAKRAILQRGRMLKRRGHPQETQG